MWCEADTKNSHVITLARTHLTTTARTKLSYLQLLLSLMAKDHQRAPPSLEVDSRHVRPERAKASGFAPSTSGRLRAACNLCHQAKIKCSGEYPCSACQGSNLQCVYSPASRQGRPKGSKNKRTLMQEREAKAIELQEGGHSQSQSHQRKEVARLQPPSGEQQHKPMSANPKLDFGSISAPNHYLSGSDLLLNQQMDSACRNTASDSYFETGLSHAFPEQHNVHAPAGSLEVEDFNVFSAQVSDLMLWTAGSQCM